MALGTIDNAWPNIRSQSDSLITQRRRAQVNSPRPAKKETAKPWTGFNSGPAGRLAGMHTIRGLNWSQKLPIDGTSHCRSDSGNRVTNIFHTHRIRRSLGRFSRFTQFVSVARAVSQDSHNSGYIHLLYKSLITQQRNFRRIDPENSDIICVLYA